MSKQTNITVTRYVDRQLGWETCVRPHDGAWALFIPQAEAVAKDGLGPQLWHRVGTCEDEHGDTHEAYALDGSPEHRAYLSEYGAGIGLTEAFDASKCSPMPAEPTTP
jgi:hypothetical protein